MDLYTNEQLVHVGQRILMCEFSISKTKETSILGLHKTDEEKLSDHLYIIKMNFYQKSFIVEFAGILSFFYKQQDPVIFQRLNANEQQLKLLQKIRGVTAHIDDFEKTIALLEDGINGSGNLKVLFLHDFEQVKEYVMELLKSQGQDAIDPFLKRLNSIGS
jgi:hypothetical protein